MKQRIVITVVSVAAAEHLLDNADKMLAVGSVHGYFDSLTASDNVLFYSDHLDLWSMGDSFDRFLRPKSRLRYFDYGSSQLYAIRRDLLRFRVSPRNDEERLFRTLLQSAKSIYRQAGSEPVLFVLRQVFDVSRDVPSNSQSRPNKPLQNRAPRGG